MRCETGKAEQIVDDPVATLVSFASLHATYGIYRILDFISARLTESTQSRSWLRQ